MASVFYTAFQAKESEESDLGPNPIWFPVPMQLRCSPKVRKPFVSPWLPLHHSMQCTAQWHTCIDTGKLDGNQTFGHSRGWKRESSISVRPYKWTQLGAQGTSLMHVNSEADPIKFSGFYSMDSLYRISALKYVELGLGHIVWKWRAGTFLLWDSFSCWFWSWSCLKPTWSWGHFAD